MIGADGGKVQVRGQIESGTKGTSAEVTQWGQPAAVERIGQRAPTLTCMPAPKRQGDTVSAPGEGKKSRTELIKAQYVLREHEMTLGHQVSDKMVNFKERNIFSLCELLVGSRLVIDLKNETRLLGTMDSSAINTNDIFLRDVEETNLLSGSTKHLESMLVRGNAIRYLHIPPEINVMDRLSTLESLREKNKARNLNVLSGHNDGTTKVSWLGDPCEDKS